MDSDDTPTLKVNKTLFSSNTKASELVATIPVITPLTSSPSSSSFSMGYTPLSSTMQPPAKKQAVSKVTSSTAKIVSKPQKPKKVAVKNTPHALLWICHHGLGQKKSWSGNTLKVIGMLSKHLDLCIHAISCYIEDLVTIKMHKTY